MTINHLHKDSIALKEITHGASNLSASNVGAEQKKKRMRRADIQVILRFFLIISSHFHSMTDLSLIIHI